MKRYDVIVLGGGPAGLAAAISASKEKASVLLIEREAKMGGILKQCIHDGFGLLRFGERLTGPEYADRFLKELLQMEIDYRTSAFVLNAKKQPGGGFRLEIQTQDGILYEECSALVLACGCREKNSPPGLDSRRPPRWRLHRGHGAALRQSYGLYAYEKSA